MLEELSKYDNLGTPNYYWEFFENVEKNDTWTVNDVSSYFFNRVIDDYGIFDGCVPLLLETNIIEISESGKIDITYKYKYAFRNEQQCKNKILEGILLAFGSDPVFFEIFAPEYSHYDFVYKSINVDFSAFGLKYASIRNLLIDFEFFKPHPDFPEKLLIINSRWKKFFEVNFSQEIRKKKIGLKELKKNLEQQQINGELAEKFVMKFEELRLSEKDGIQWIAPYDPGAGYDVSSFNDESSTSNDRLIEVKSYSGSNMYFYWSKNEVDTARKHADKYCIYLVNRDELLNINYEPVIVFNPIENILNNDEWKKTISKYFITRK